MDDCFYCGSIFFSRADPCTPINDEKLCLIRDKILRGEAKEVVLDSDGVLRIGGRICVPKTGDLIRLILEEAHCSRYSIHPEAAKMYHDLT